MHNYENVAFKKFSKTRFSHMMPILTFPDETQVPSHVPTYNTMHGHTVSHPLGPSHWKEKPLFNGRLIVTWTSFKLPPQGLPSRQLCLQLIYLKRKQFQVRVP